MLGKLMKYELRATGRMMLPLFLLTLLLGVFTRMSTAVVQHTHTNITESLNMLLIFAFVLALIGTAVFSVILMVMRFRNNLMTDEGYLMFTLPVSVHQLLWAKLLVSMLWFVAVFCVTRWPFCLPSMKTACSRDCRSSSAAPSRTWTAITP